MFLIKNILKEGDALVSLLFNFALDYAIWTVQVNQDGTPLLCSVTVLLGTVVSCDGVTWHSCVVCLWYMTKMYYNGAVWHSCFV